MRKLDGSDLLSNILILTSVILACTPFVLGERLVPTVATLLNETVLIFEQLSTFLMGLIS